ncbi:MAG: 3-hydroxybutyryl-CoA dehydrogenase [Acetobacteraceae bacterium]|jgi:3-hydroxybutyryl-CoA dehydrogenase|nr:hbd [Rhodopila sp.]MEA2726609.1 3-hydroxybutyryl-CoA dehydrogenase [Acetobacteraceae bacterium]MEA2774560.1 3-hydroxybutyryl-CoA dehydrogenase [Acetobacteraceae bacterium]
MNVDFKSAAGAIIAPMVIEPPEIKSVGVIGAGQMGNGIAHVCALAGLPVTIVDIKQEALTKAMDIMARNMERQVHRSIITSDQRDEALARVKSSTDYAAFTDVDLVIEAATEKEDLKRLIFKSLIPNLKPSCLIASNTSSISITRLGAVTDRAEKFIGMHFMNPVPVMKLVEIIRGIATDEPTFQAVKNLAQNLGKVSAVSEDFPAFIVNRILVPMINEAVYALYEGVGSVSGIDTSMKLGANHPMGPLELADFIGLDTCLSIMQVLHEGLADSKYRPCPLLVKYVEAGWYGRKTGRGFYDYTQTPPRPTR